MTPSDCIFFIGGESSYFSAAIGWRCKGTVERCFMPTLPLICFFFFVDSQIPSFLEELGAPSRKGRLHAFLKDAACRTGCASLFVHLP